MLVLKPEHRAMFADKLPDTANLALGALVFGQFLAEGAFRPWSRCLVSDCGCSSWAVP